MWKVFFKEKHEGKPEILFLNINAVSEWAIKRIDEDFKIYISYIFKKVSKTKSKRL